MAKLFQFPSRSPQMPGRTGRAVRNRLPASTGPSEKLSGAQTVLEPRLSCSGKLPNHLELQSLLLLHESAYNTLPLGQLCD